MKSVDESRNYGLSPHSRQIFTEPLMKQHCMMHQTSPHDRGVFARPPEMIHTANYMSSTPMAPVIDRRIYGR